MTTPTANGDISDPPLASRARLPWLLMLGVLVIGLTADLWSKSWAFDTISHAPIVLDRDHLVSDPGFDPTLYSTTRTVIPNFLQFKLVLNPGAVFGIGANHRTFFICFTVVAVAVGLWVFGWHTHKRQWAAHLAIGLVLAGGLGNLYDRVMIGRVRDFIHALHDRMLPNGWTWWGTNNPEMFPWVFNIADVLLLVGMIMIMVSMRRSRHARRAKRLAQAMSDDS